MPVTTRKRKRESEEKKKREKAEKVSSFSPFDKVPKDVLIHILHYVNSSKGRVCEFWQKIDQEIFAPQRKKEIFELLLGKKVIATMLVKYKTITMVEQEIEKIINFKTIVKDLNLNKLNKMLLGTNEESFGDEEYDFESFPSYSEMVVAELKDMTIELLPIKELMMIGMENHEIMNCGSILIAAAYLKKYGSNFGNGYSLIRIYTQAGFDKGLNFLLANGAEINHNNPDSFTSLSVAAIAKKTKHHEDFDKFAFCLETLLNYGAQFREERDIFCIKDAFFHRKLSDFIFERISVSLLLDAQPSINLKFLDYLKINLGNCKNNIIDIRLHNRLNTCNANLSLFADLLTRINLALLSKYPGETVSNIKLSESCRKDLARENDSVEQLVFDAKECDKFTQTADFLKSELTDEQITLFERRNLLIKYLLITNLELGREIAEKNDPAESLNLPSLQK